MIGESFSISIRFEVYVTNPLGLVGIVLFNGLLKQGAHVIWTISYAWLNIKTVKDIKIFIIWRIRWYTYLFKGVLRHLLELFVATVGLIGVGRGHVYRFLFIRLFSFIRINSKTLIGLISSMIPLVIETGQHALHFGLVSGQAWHWNILIVILIAIAFFLWVWTSWWFTLLLTFTTILIMIETRLQCRSSFASFLIISSILATESYNRNLLFIWIALIALIGASLIIFVNIIIQRVSFLIRFRRRRYNWIAAIRVFLNNLNFYHFILLYDYSFR